MTAEEITSDFIKLLSSVFKHETPIVMGGILAGISIRRGYAEKTLRKLRDPSKKFFSLIKILIEDEDLLNEDLIRKPIYVRLDFVLDNGSESFPMGIDSISNKKVAPLNILS